MMQFFFSFLLSEIRAAGGSPDGYRWCKKQGAGLRDFLVSVLSHWSCCYCHDDKPLGLEVRCLVDEVFSALTCWWGSCS